MSSVVLREICKGRTADSLPLELRRFSTLEEIPIEDPHMAAGTQATQDPQTTQDLY